MSRALPGLKDFYVAGQWVEPGGSSPTAVMSRRNDTQVLCKQDRRKSVTSTPHHAKLAISPMDSLFG
jgi:hypothetical protein